MYLGIDFGTSFSQASTMYLEQPLLLLNPGEYGIPSEFYYDHEVGILVGQDALDAGQGNDAANLVSEVKMAILSGQSFSLGGRKKKTFTAKDIVKEIYKALISKAVQVARKKTINVDIEGVVISVPAKFGMQERKLISEAARDCLGTKKIPIKGIIKEPVAAAIAYYNMELEDDKCILVYDLGGGTCDVALVKADSSSREHYTVIDSDMVRLGGRNWDEELIKYLTVIVEKKSGLKITGNVGFEEKIRRTAISVKHDLSDSMKSRALARIELNGRIFTVPVTRKIFDEITAHLLRETLDCLQDIYDKYKYDYHIEEIICVGGGSNMLQVEEGLLKRFGQCTIRLYEPEHAVVNGATIYANMDDVVVDVASFSYGQLLNTHYGYEDNEEIISNIILKGNQLPAVNFKNARPVVDNQKFLEIKIYESEIDSYVYSSSERNKRFVGVIKLELSRGIGKDTNIRCQIKLNAEGLLEVEASEPSGRKVRSVFNLQHL